MTRPHKYVSQAILSFLNPKKQSVSSQNTNQEAFAVNTTRSRGVGWQAQDRVVGKVGKRMRRSINHLERFLASVLVSERFRSGFDVGYIVIPFSSAPLPTADFLVSKDCV